MDPLVTVAIPTFNRPEQCREAVASALAQSYPQLDVLVGDNGSSDPLRAWCESVQASDPRLQYRRNERNLGMAGNWNALADHARGELFVLLADDDRLLPTCVSTLVAAIRKYDAQLAFSNHYVIDNDGKRLEDESVRLTHEYHRNELSAGTVANAEMVVWQVSISIAAAMLRTRDVRRLRFKEDLNTPEIELFARLAQSGARFAFVPDYLSEYRVHAGSATAAGLWSERLAEYLLPITVAPEVEPFKRSFMQSLLQNAVSRCLAMGEPRRARRLLAAQYYPRGGFNDPKGLVYRTCAYLPTPLSQAVFRVFQSAYRRSRPGRT